MRHNHFINQNSSMRKEILDALKTRFAGVSDKILGRIADKLAKTVTTQEQVATAVEGVTFQQVLESYGDSRATEATQTAVNNYEAKHGLKNGKPVATEAEPDEPAPTKNGVEEEMPAWAKSIIESNKALAEQVKTMQGERLAATRRDQLNQIISALPSHFRKAYERTPVETLSDDEFESLKSDITSEVETISRETSAKGATFGRPTIQGGTKTQAGDEASAKEATDEEAAAVVDKLAI